MSARQKAVNTKLKKAASLRKLLKARIEAAQEFCEERFPVVVLLDSAENYPNDRDYAMCGYDGKEITIFVAPRFMKASKDRQDALIRHELGHACTFVKGKRWVNKKCSAMNIDLPVTEERRADMIAKVIWDDSILYDQEFVQSLKRGITPRPAFLGL